MNLNILKNLFWMTLAIIGILQFFSLPKYLDYMLLAFALILGTIIISRTFQGSKAD